MAMGAGDQFGHDTADGIWVGECRGWHRCNDRCFQTSSWWYFGRCQCCNGGCKCEWASTNDDEQGAAIFDACEFGGSWWCGANSWTIHWKTGSEIQGGFGGCSFASHDFCWSSSTCQPEHLVGRGSQSLPKYSSGWIWKQFRSSGAHWWQWQRPASVYP